MLFLRVFRLQLMFSIAASRSLRRPSADAVRPPVDFSRVSEKKTWYPGYENVAIIRKLRGCTLDSKLFPLRYPTAPLLLRSNLLATEITRNIPNCCACPAVFLGKYWVEETISLISQHYFIRRKQSTLVVPSVTLVITSFSFAQNC